jgi:hypothetical protein
MAAFLTMDVLRAHTAPGLPLARPRHAPAHACFMLPQRPAFTAPRLFAPDGRLTRRGPTDVSAPFGPPPH